MDSQTIWGVMVTLWITIVCRTHHRTSVDVARIIGDKMVDSAKELHSVKLSFSSS